MSVSPKTKASLLAKQAVKSDADYLVEAKQILEALSEHLTEMAQRRSLRLTFSISNAKWPEHEVVNLAAVKVVDIPAPSTE